MFQLFKDDGTSVQLDANTQVMSYLGKYTMTPGQWAAPITVGPYTWSRGSISLPLTVKTIGVSDSGGGFVSVMYSRVEGSNRVFYLGGDRRATVVFHLYGDKQISSGSHGLQLFADNGDLTFDSTSKFLRISQIITPADASTVSLNVSRSFAVIIGNHQTWIRSNRIAQRPAFLIIRRSVKMAPGLLTMGAVTEQGPPWDRTPPATPVPAMPPIVVADVTGY